MYYSFAFGISLNKSTHLLMCHFGLSTMFWSPATIIVSDLDKIPISHLATTFMTILLFDSLKWIMCLQNRHMWQGRIQIFDFDDSASR